MIRKLGTIAFLGLIGMVLLSSEPTIEAQAKKKTDLNKLNQQLKKTLAERDQRIRNLDAELKRVRQENANYKKKNPDKLQSDLDDANKKIKEQEDLIDSLKKGDLPGQVAALRKKVKELGAIKNAPIVHTKILKLKKANDEEIKKIQTEAAKTLAKIEGVRAIWIGKPVESPAPDVAQKGYHLGVMVLLDDADGLQKFVEDSLHKQFTDRLADLWDAPIVYNIQREKDAAKDDVKKKKKDE